MREFGRYGDEDSPHADEFDLDVDGERAFEFVGLLPAEAGRIGVHPVRERDLLMVPCGEEADLVRPTLGKVQSCREGKFSHLVNHPCERPSSVCSSRKPKHAYFSSGFV